MMVNQHVLLWNRRDGKTRECTVSFSDADGRVLRLQSDGEPEICVRGESLFRCLLQVRRRLEQRGWLMLCGGARLDVMETGLINQMSDGLRVWILGPVGDAKQWRPHMSIGILDPSSREAVGTAEEQRRYQNEWQQVRQSKGSAGDT